MNALDTLCNIIAQRGIASEKLHKREVGYDLLLARSLLRNNCVVQSVACDACDDPHDAQVVFEDGTYGHYCPDFGFIQLDDFDIKGVQADIAKLVGMLADTLDCKRRKATPIRSDVSRIGALDTPKGDLVLYFTPVLRDETQAQNVMAALGQEVHAAFRLILTAEGALSVAGAKTACLAGVFDLSDRGRTLETIVDPRVIVGAPKEIQNGRPSPYATKLAGLILPRIADGSALTGRNAEARVIGQLFQSKYPSEKQPSVSVIRKQVTKLHGGSKLDQN